MIAGEAKGTRLLTLEGADTRPTLGRVKEAAFSILGGHVPGARVLDLFGGSGQLAIEALSRGADCAVIVDVNRKAAEIISKNLEKTRLQDRARIIASDWRSALKRLKAEDALFDLAMLDPPYGYDILREVLSEVSLSGIMSPEAKILCELGADEWMPELFGGEAVFRLESRHKYGSVAIAVYKNFFFVDGHWPSA